MPKILLTSDDHAHRITLNSPPLNILDIGMLGELREALAGVRPDRHALIVDAAGATAFSAGVSVPDHLPGRVEAMLPLFHDCIRALARLDLVTVALVRGAAVGGGSELAFACDFVLAGDSARFGQPEINLGVFAPVASWQLSRQLPPRRGLELLLTGEPLDAHAAERLGLVNAVFPSAEFEERSAAWLGNVYRQSRSSLHLAKKAFRVAGSSDFEDRLARTERLYVDELMKTHDALEGLRAFLDKRRPEWSGK